MYSVGNVSSKESTWADQGRVRRNNGEPGPRRKHTRLRRKSLPAKKLLVTERRTVLIPILLPSLFPPPA